jgi:hypothetical protein
VDKPLTLRSANGPDFVAIDGAGSIGCVYLTNGAFLSGFTLTNGFAGGGGGVYCDGALAVVSNCVLIGNSARSDCGECPAGGGAAGGTLIDCMIVSNFVSKGNGAGADGSTLLGCKIIGNRARDYGGGVDGCQLSNCTLSGNSALYGGGANESTLNGCILSDNSANYAGGALGGTLNNCILTRNVATNGVAGAGQALLNNCTLVENRSESQYEPNEVGGASMCTLNNCILYSNESLSGIYNNYDSGTFYHCCTTPLPAGYTGYGNITNPPLFVSQDNGDLRLLSNSPCINAGNNAYAGGSTDLDGNPRIRGGTVDIGAYEFQAPASLISYAWLQQHGLPTDGSADYTDLDGDGMNNWQEWRCGTDPSSALSVLRVLSALPTGTNVIVTWQSVAGINYFLERSTTPGAASAFTPVVTNIAGLPDTSTFTDTNGVVGQPAFYRVGVQY